MTDVEVIQVVRTRLLLRGDGKDDPVRRITQYWTLDGELLAEVDPIPAETRTAAAIDAALGGKVGLGFQTPGTPAAGVTRC